MQNFLNTVFWNNTLLSYLIFLGSFIICLLILIIIRKIMLHRLAACAKKTPTSLDDMLIRTFKKYIMPILYFAALYFNLYWLTVNQTITTIANYTMLAVLAIFRQYRILLLTLLTIVLGWGAGDLIIQNIETDMQVISVSLLIYCIGGGIVLILCLISFFKLAV